MAQMAGRDRTGRTLLWICRDCRADLRWRGGLGDTPAPGYGAVEMSWYEYIMFGLIVGALSALAILALQGIGL